MATLTKTQQQALPLSNVHSHLGAEQKTDTDSKAFDAADDTDSKAFDAAAAELTEEEGLLSNRDTEHRGHGPLMRSVQMHSNHPSPQSVQAAADAAQAKTDAATYQRALDAPDCTGGRYERTTYGERQCTQGTQVITNEQDCE